MSFFFLISFVSPMSWNHSKTCRCFFFFFIIIMFLRSVVCHAFLSFFFFRLSRPHGSFRRHAEHGVTEPQCFLSSFWFPFFLSKKVCVSAPGGRRNTTHIVYLFFFVAGARTRSSIRDIEEQWHIGRREQMNAVRLLFYSCLEWMCFHEDARQHTHAHTHTGNYMSADALWRTHSQLHADAKQ